MKKITEKGVQTDVVSPFILANMRIIKNSFVYLQTKAWRNHKLQ